tara:strand:+ start:626 stop:901 length:276 start_codon:yes stop_codon:yes gene_type:complete
MSLGKKDIAKDISSKAQISLADSKKLLDIFIDIVSTKSFNHIVKISNFGSFYFHKSPKRIGRNPITKKTYVINERSKLSLKASNKIKKLIN